MTNSSLTFSTSLANSLSTTPSKIENKFLGVTNVQVANERKKGAANDTKRGWQMTQKRGWQMNGWQIYYHRFYFVSRTSRRRDTHVFRWYLLAPHSGWCK